MYFIIIRASPMPIVALYNMFWVNHKKVYATLLLKKDFGQVLCYAIPN
jgi:hypothetical protein